MRDTPERSHVDHCWVLFLARSAFENQAGSVRDPFLDAAFELAEKGYHCFPLGRNSKVPRKDLKRWEMRATRDPLKIAQWWRRYPGSNIGVACAPSVILVVDLDVPKGNRTEDGRQTFWDLIKKHRIPWEPTRQIRTASGGVHLVYKMPPGGLNCSSGRLGPGIDTRATGGYVVGPGSVIDGRRYELEVRGPVRELPRRLVELLRTPTVEQREPIPVRGDIDRYMAAAMRNEIRRLEDAPEGQRNVTLLGVSRRLGRLVGAGRLDRSWVEDALLIAGRRTGLGERECVATIQSGLRYGEAHPNPLAVVHDQTVA